VETIASLQLGSTSVQIFLSWSFHPEDGGSLDLWSVGILP